MAAFIEIYLGEFLGGPVVRTQAFTTGTQVQSLVVEPRSSKLHRAAKRLCVCVCVCVCVIDKIHTYT